MADMLGPFRGNPFTGDGGDMGEKIKIPEEFRYKIVYELGDCAIGIVACERGKQDEKTWASKKIGWKNGELKNIYKKSWGDKIAITLAFEGWNDKTTLPKYGSVVKGTFPFSDGKVFRSDGENWIEI